MKDDETSKLLNPERTSLREFLDGFNIKRGGKVLRLTAPQAALAAAAVDAYVRGVPLVIDWRRTWSVKP